MDRSVRAVVVVAVLSFASLVAVAHVRQQPTFRTGVNYVRVDVFPTIGGLPVADLAKSDFEILEDGVLQTVDSFEHVTLRPRDATAERVEPRDVRESNEMAGDARNRVFVLFLDTYHVTDDTSMHNAWLPSSPTERAPADKKPLGLGRIDRALVTFLDRAIAPGDLFAPFTPEMDLAQLAFTRRPENFEDLLGTVWGRRYNWSDLDPEEMRWALCYPPDEPHGCYRGILEEMVDRRREGLTLDAAERLVQRLGQLRQERKAVLLVSEGWALYRENRQLARIVPQDTSQGCLVRPEDMPQGKGIYVGTDGKPKAGTDTRTYVNVDWQQCESARTTLASADDELRYRRLMDEANRTNTSFYPVDPRGLAVFDMPIDAASPGAPGFAPVESPRRLAGRLESMRNLAVATDGRMTESNDIAGGLRKIADDLSDYYLLGYSSTNTKADGRFRKITVRVKRPGVAVRARRGYLAATEGELAAQKAAAAPPDPEVATREAALASLGTIRSDRPFHLAAGVAWHSAAAGVGAPAQAVAWIAGDLDTTAVREAAWSSGGEVSVTIVGANGQTVASERATVSPAARGFLLRSEARLEPGEYLVRAQLRGLTSEGAPAVEQVRIKLLNAAPGATVQLGDPVVFRRGPYSGPGFQPTADVRFRRAERVRVDVPVSAAVADGAVAARVLDRKGQPLPVPVSAGVREEAGVRLLSGEVALAPLAFGDYLIEVGVRRGDNLEKVLAAIRVVQ